MSRRQRWLTAAIAFGVAMGAGTFIANYRQPRDTEPATDAFPRLLATRLPDSSGSTQALRQWQGKTLLINFWATWCPPCREEMPALTRLQEKYAANGVQTVGIALDSADNVARYAASHPTGYPLLVGDANTAELYGALGNSQSALPYTVVFDPDGNVKMTHLGRISETELDALFSKLVVRQ